MDKCFPKLGDVTIERRTKKNNQSATVKNNAITFKSKEGANVYENFQIPKGITVQPPKRSEFMQDNRRLHSEIDDFADFNDDYDELPEDVENAVEEDMSYSDQLETANSDNDNDGGETNILEAADPSLPGEENLQNLNKSVDMLHSEDELPLEEHQYEDFDSEPEDTGEFDNNDPNPMNMGYEEFGDGSAGSRSTPSKPILPPGITLERKKPVGSTKPNIQLPLGIRLEKRSPVEVPKPAAPSQTGHVPFGMVKQFPVKQQPMTGTQTVKTPQTFRPTMPSMTTPMRMPVRGPPVNKQPPRFSKAVPNFLVQQTHAGNSAIAMDTSPSKIKPGQSIMPSLKQIRPPSQFEMPKLMQMQRPGKIQNPRPPLPVKSNITPHLIKFPNKSEEYLKNEAIQQPKLIPKLPSGITVHPRKQDVNFMPGSPSSSTSSPKSLPKIPAGVTLQPRKIESPKLPAGITLQPKVQPVLAKNYNFEDQVEEESDEGEVDEEEEYFDEGHEFDSDPHFGTSGEESSYLDQKMELSPIKKTGMLLESLVQKTKPSPGCPTQKPVNLGGSTTGLSGNSVLKSPASTSLSPEPKANQQLEERGDLWSNEYENQSYEAPIKPKPPSQLPRLPPGINIEKVPKILGSLSEQPLAEIAQKFQLPPGVTLAKKTPCNRDNDQFPYNDPEDNDYFPEEEDFEEEEEPDLDQNEEGGEAVEASTSEQDMNGAQKIDDDVTASLECPIEEDNTNDLLSRSGENESDDLAYPESDNPPLDESHEPMDGDMYEGDELDEYEENEDDALMQDGSSEMEDGGLPKSDVLDFESLISASNKSPTVDSEIEEGADDSKFQDDEKGLMQNLVDMMTKGEIEGEIEDESDEKRGEKRKSDDIDDDRDDSSSKKMKESDDDDEEFEDGEVSGSLDKAKVSGTHLRKNIREVMDETKLDEATLAAQRQEAERLKRLQEQQRIIRDVQRQIQQNKQTQKIQSKVLSLLQSNTQTSILKTSSVNQVASVPQEKAPNSVLLKMSNGQQTDLNEKVRELLKGPGKSSFVPPITTNFLKQGMVSPSVTIAPIKKEEEKKKKIVTLSSDSDDDCIVLSDEEIESEPDEDPTNSGMHTADRYNVTDEQGRVLVNTTHPPGEPDVFLAPQIARAIKPHQIGGVRFLYDNIIESIERYNTSSGFGCILAHSMGLGKTLQIVSFSDIFLRHTSGKKILVIMPINTIQNWLSEYNMWTPKENHTDTDVRCRNFDVYVVNESLKNVHSRGRVILEWHKNGGVLLMGYELFRLLSLKKPIKSKRKRPDESEEERNRELVEEIYCALVKPGPDLVICDEGHRIKNSHATTSQALKQIRTRRRVVLTGYPLQNNLVEYWCMVDFVRPNYLGTKAEFCNMFERPIQNGQCIDSTPQDKRLMRFRAHVLHSLLEGFVQRRSHSVLQEVLPQKEEYVLLLRFTPFQHKLYHTFMKDVIRVVAVPNPLKAFAVCCKIWNHPDVLYNFLKKKGEQIDLDLEEAIAPSMMPPRPMDTPVPGLTANNNVPAVPWPRRGPGSRGGKVRQTGKRKAQSPVGKAAQAVGLNDKQQQQQSQTQPVLPSMSQFAVQSGSTFSQGVQDNMSTFSTSTNYQQSNYYQQQQSQQQQQQQQHQQPSQTQQQSSDDYSYQRSNYDSNLYATGGADKTESKLYDSSDSSLFTDGQQKSFDDKMFVKDQISDPQFGANNYGSNLEYQNQRQFPQNSGNTGQFSGGNVQQPFYQHNETSVGSGYDYSQSTTDMTDFSHYSDSGFDNSNFGATSSSDLQSQQQQQQYWGNNWPSCGGGTYSGGSSSDEFMSPPKFSGYDVDRKNDTFEKQGCDFGDSYGMNLPKMGKIEKEEDKKLSSIVLPHSMPQMTTPTKTDVDEKKDDLKLDLKKEDVPYDWATELFKNYVTGIIENSSKMEVFFVILNESVARQDRILLFSQSLLTLDLIETYLQQYKVPGCEEHWAKNRNYFRLDGSTPALEREKLINEFNSTTHVKLFLVSTRAGSLGINLVGANRVIVFDASWNPCHDTQAVCRVYRYGQQKPCFVYRLVMDSCLEKKIYDRQINKQGMADRVVDELNPDAHLSLKEVTNLCWDDQEETPVQNFSDLRNKYNDDIIKTLLVKHSSTLSRAPFQHESLLIDRKEKKLSQAEKRLAKRSYELEKQAANQPRSLYQFLPSPGIGMRGLPKPIASVKPMQNERFGAMPARSKWISADVWQKQGMSAQEMTLPLDVVIPTNSPDKTSIVLKAGQRVMVLKSPKGIYMQLETGKIIAIRSAFKVGQPPEKTEEKKAMHLATALKNNPNVTITQKSTLPGRPTKPPFLKPSSYLDKKAAAVNMAASRGRVGVNKSRAIPFSRKLQTVSTSDRERFLSRTNETLRDFDKSRDGTGGTLEESDHPMHGTNFSDNQSQMRMPDVQQHTTAGSSMDTQVMTNMATSVTTGMDKSQVMPQSDTWDRDIAKESLNSLNSMVKDPGVLNSQLPELSTADTEKTDVNKSATQNPNNYPYGYPPESKDGQEIKKEDDPMMSWPMGHPYGNFYPGYYGYGPMPGYDGFPYPHNYRPHPPVPIKTETPDGSQVTPPPAPYPPSGPAAPPMYPPYPAPYPYPYNYPPFPPQAQPPNSTALPPYPPQPQHPSQSTTPTKTAEGTGTDPPAAPSAASFGPHYAARPPYPTPPAPGFYPNYPPYRPPYPDPNFPYNPYMPPPGGYGYRMQGPHQGNPMIPPHHPQYPLQQPAPEPGATSAPASSATETPQNLTPQLT